MDSCDDPRYSKAFRIKKWSLFIVCAIGILATVIMVILAGKLIDKYREDNISGNDYDKDFIKKIAKVLVYVTALLSFLFYLVGLIGAYKEHYCMTATFAVLSTIGAIANIWVATDDSVYCATAVVNFVVCVLAYAFARDLRERRKLAFCQPVVIATPTPEQLCAPHSQY